MLKELSIMCKFKSFMPKTDLKRRLVLTRFYCGVKGHNSFMYEIHKITKHETVHCGFKHLYAIGTDDFESVDGFHHSKTGEPVQVFKSAFKGVSGCVDKLNILNIWKRAIYLHTMSNGHETL